MSSISLETHRLDKTLDFSTIRQLINKYKKFINNLN